MFQILDDILGSDFLDLNMQDMKFKLPYRINILDKLLKLFKSNFES